MSDHHDDAEPTPYGRDAAHPEGSAAGDQDRRAELIAAAIGGDLTAQEAQELALLRQADPELDQELLQLREMTSALGQHVSSWREEAPSASLRDRVITAAQAPPHATAQEPAHAPVKAPAHVPAQEPAKKSAHSGPATLAAFRVPRRARRLTLLAAACVAVGAGAALGVQATMDSEPLGPPGMLGASEPVSFSDPGVGVDVDGSLVAHTWGTETVLEVEGLPVGAPFTVVLVGEDGQEIESGSFLGSEVPVDCRMNGAVLREDVERLEIRDDSGATITAAELPEVDSSEAE